ncbi:hypothetical protein BDV34DRAFT_232037 [Aspergillus parasiticus]|uniref:Uncharacterized protein n=1 Tax=Aspergillus parasiticus TaxID=5067 RepID=A0A5N6D689_ASPPA|nr:hypothetical protein BDV34DRAFT_232037 [Aspergillus parasiticus]
MGPEEYQSRQELLDRFHIKFLGSIEPEDWPEHWPETRRRLFRDVATLGEKRYHDFDEGVSIDAIEKPWRGQIKRRAARLVVLAKRCRREGSVESGWRARIEHEVLYRFTVEVSCPTCRERLWRSEIEAAFESIETEAPSLEDRRRQRKPCRCPAKWGQNQYDYGVNMIFSDRAETSIHYDPPLHIASSRRPIRKYERPDRVYGLRQTENFKVLLDSTDKRVPLDENTRALRHTLEVSPFKRDREPLLFPFLIIEAKSDTVGDSAAAEMQTAFCIRRLLMLQDELRAATGEESLWKTGPLVWFFVWHGHDWIIKAGFIDDRDSSVRRYYTLDLWKGDICEQSGALRLLLIVDYIFDWARDVYRKSILDELNVLAAEEMRFNDPDIFSTIDRRESLIASEWPGFSQEVRDDNGPGEVNDAPASSSVIDNRQFLGVVKEASIIQSRFLALHITEDDVETFLLSFPSVEASNSVVRSMMQCLKDSWRVTAEALSGIESLWTSVGPKAEYHDSEEIFHVKVFILMHVSMDWVPVRQLTYLAISERALQVLLSKAGLLSTSNLTTPFQNVPVIEKPRLEAFLISVKEQSIVDNLTAAVSMLCISSVCYRRAGRIPAKWLLKRANNYFAGFGLDGSPVVLELVTSIYESHKIGRREPTDSYIRFSRNQTSQTISSREKCLWPRLDPICQDTNGCALVDGLNLDTNHARHCLYVLTRRDRNLLDTPYIVESISEDGLYYSTLQLGPNFRPGEYFQHLNRSTSSNRLWREMDTYDSLKKWAEGLKQTKLVTAAGDSIASPIVLLSDEEAVSDAMDED